MVKQRLLHIISVLILLVGVSNLFAGNEQRAGQAGATELLINPWGRSAGLANANTSSARGLESQFLNVAGTAFTPRTELIFSRSNWFVGTDIFINAFGFSQKAGESGVITMGVMTMDFGEIDITTVDHPEGGLGTFHPRYTNISLSYAKEFSNSIYGGLTLKVINESISNLNASGVALDAGIQYVTGKNKEIMFGISLKNVGPTMSFEGDGMSFRGTAPNGVSMTVEQRSADFELPSLLNIGAAYAFTHMIPGNHGAELSFNFASNSFTKDQYSLGLEYNFKKILYLRGGFVYESGLFDDDERTTVFTGPTCGTSVQIPLNKEKGSSFSLDYSYRFTNPFGGVHTFGARVNL